MIKGGLFGNFLQKKLDLLLNIKNIEYKILLLGYIFLFIFYFIWDTSPLYCIDGEKKLLETAKGINPSVTSTLEVNNLKVSGLDVAIEQARDGAVYIGGMAAATKLIKSSCLPIGGKVAMALGAGASSLIGFKMVQNSFHSNRGYNNIAIQADRVKTNTALSSSSKDVPSDNYPAKSILEASDSIENKNYIISSLDVSQLHLDFYLHLITLYLLILVILFLIMKNISISDMKFDLVKKWPMGNYVHYMLIYIFKFWKKTTDIWIYIGLFFIISNIIISTWSLYVVINNII